MSVHSDLIESVATPLLLEAAGETIQVQLKGADAPVELTALVNRERTIRKYTAEGTKLVRQRRVTFTTDEDSRFGGVSNVMLNAVVTIGSGDDAVDYAVAEKPSVLDGTVSVLLECPAVETRTESHYRNR